MTPAVRAEVKRILDDIAARKLAERLVSEGKSK